MERAPSSNPVSLPSSSFSFPFPIKIEFPSTTFLVPDQEEAETEVKSTTEIPRPLGCLHETPIPPFLSKTYDIVDDPSVDAVVSWGPAGKSFVVWDPYLFEKAVLPRNFKHSNFSSFVRQLNTYSTWIGVNLLVLIPLEIASAWRNSLSAYLLKGFHKISADRLEFANEWFQQGNKQLLKNINRRRSHAGAQTSSFLATVSSSQESELHNLRKDKNTLVQEVLRLQQDHLTAIQQMSSLNQKIQSAEERQKQMVSFYAKILRNPNLLAQFRIHQEQKQRKKFLQENQPDQYNSALWPQIPDAIQHDAAKQPKQGNELKEAASLPENVFPEPGLSDVQLHGRLSAEQPVFKGKAIVEKQQHGISSDQEQNTEPFANFDPSLLELPDAFYDLDLDFYLDMAPVNNIDDHAPTRERIN